MSHSFNALAARLQPYYTRFDVANRLLFTGHSHQAWPDAAAEGLKDSLDAAARFVDNKWGMAFFRVDVLRNYLMSYYDDPDGQWCHAPNTHDLIVRWLSALPLKPGASIVTTDGEFYSAFRQFKSLETLGIQVRYVESYPSDAIYARFEAAVDSTTVAMFASRVFFQTGLINPAIEDLGRLAARTGIPLMIDDYHGTNVLPFSLKKASMEHTWWLIGGYKYLQWGEGNCFIRYPADDRLEPKVTGWFASFSTLSQPRESYRLAYDPHMKYAGATFDPASAFRAARVAEFFKEHHLTPDLLHKTYREQVAYLRARFLNELDGHPDIRLKHLEPAERNGGFLALHTPAAVELHKQLLEKGVFTDARGSTLRFGPAPYVTSDQMDEAMRILAAVVKK